MKVFKPMTVTNAVQEKFASARRELSTSLIERDDEVDLVLTALACQEHVLLVGAPGSAKSLLLDSIMRWMSGKRFSILFTKFTSPEEVFGPVSLKGLKEDRYVRVTTGKLPEADLVFTDEIFKASSAILNTLLRVLNERVFENGDGSFTRVPLKLCLAASNEWPQSQDGGKELEALHDRFLFRKAVRPILSQAGRSRLLWELDHTPTLTTMITPEEVDLVREQASALSWTVEAKEAMEAVLRELTREGISPGDRRQFKAVRAAKAYAWLDGADAVRPEHLEVLRHVLWDSPEEQPDKAAQVIAKIANPVGMRVSQLLLECEQVISCCEVRNLASAAAAAAKLGEIDKQLGTLSGNGRLEKARKHVKDQIKKLRLASIEAV
jgi:MoxR-like ATPase